MGRIIAITNQKGGVGKTTTAINLSACLAEAGQRVLTVDFDPQGNATSGLGLEKGNIDNTVYELLMGECQVGDCIMPSVQERLDVMPSDVDLSGAEIELLDMKDKENILKENLNLVKDNYDFIIIDCPPSLSLLTINALTAANTALIPIQCEYYALEGLNQVLKTVNLVQKKLNPELEVEGVVFTMYDSRTNLSLEVVENVKEHLNENIYKTIIPRNVRLAEAPSYGMPINMYDSRSTGAENYRLLAAEVISRGEENAVVKEEKPSAAEKKEKGKTSSGTGNGKKAEKIIVEKIVEKPVEQKLKVSLIEPNGTQPRKNFDEAALQELADSIKTYGVLQPLIVQKKDSHYEIIAGERRWRAAKLAGLTEVPVMIREYDKQKTMEIALIENVQRADLNPIEEAQAYQRLIQEFHLTQEEIAARVSKNRATVTNSMRLLKLDDRVQQLLIDEKISSGHARALLGLEDGERQFQTAQKIVEERLSVRDVEKLVKLLNRPEKPKKEVETGPDINLIYRQIEDKLKSIMGTKVLINRKDKNKGRIEIEYYSQEELERLIEMMESIARQ